MTDERIGDEPSLLGAVRQLPRGAGIIFRHYSLAPGARRTLFEKVQRWTRRKQLVLLLAGTAADAARWGAGGFHLSRFARHFPHCREKRAKRLLCSIPVHNLREVREAERYGADLLFLSPLFATRSHPGARPLGRNRFARIATQTRLPVIALGGISVHRPGSFSVTGAYGWAAIDGLTTKRAATLRMRPQSS